MLEHDKDGPYWMVGDVRHARRYLRTFAIDPKNNKAMKEAGIMVKADTLAELAAKLEHGSRPPGGDRRPVQRLRPGRRRRRLRPRQLGLRPLLRRPDGPPQPLPRSAGKGPVHRVPRWCIGDLGTKGGVVTDAEARALREDGTVIEGLYSAGNNSASVMGRTYPGPGSTIGPAVVFGLRGARHMATQGG